MTTDLKDKENAYKQEIDNLEYGLKLCEDAIPRADNWELFEWRQRRFEILQNLEAKKRLLKLLYDELKSHEEYMTRRMAIVNTELKPLIKKAKELKDHPAITHDQRTLITSITDKYYSGELKEDKHRDNAHKILISILKQTQKDLVQSV